MMNDDSIDQWVIDVMATIGDGSDGRQVYTKQINGDDWFRSVELREGDAKQWHELTNTI
jgi:hypothetical protein